MKIRAKRSALVISALCLVGVLAAAHGRESGTRVRIGESTYLFPREFGVPPGSDNKAVFLQFALPDWTPLERDVTGWDDNVNVLIQPLLTDFGMQSTIPELYDSQFDGTPDHETSRWAEIDRVYRIDPGLTVHEMGSGFDTLIPDQDMSKMPEGIIICTRSKDFFSNASCGLLFDYRFGRWKLTFGRKFLGDYEKIRARATAVIKGYEVKL